MIRIQGLRKSFGQVEVLKDISMQIQDSEMVSIVGASGAGKTTLLQIMGTLEKADAGTIEIHGKDITGMSQKELAQFRNQEIGFVFQFHQLLPEFTALENVCMPAWIAHKSESETRKQAKELLEILGLSHRIKHKPSELSGGEQQRVAVARALINKPAVILADEPSGNLDSQSASSLHDLFFTLRDTFKQTFVVVTHNETLAQRSDRILHMQDGRISSSGLV